MRRWFLRLPVHRKLVVMSLAVSGAALLAAIAVLIAIDAGRFRNAATEDADALARVLAENTAAAVVFGDPAAARDTVASVRVRPTIARACVYTSAGAPFAGYARRPDAGCPAPPRAFQAWRSVGVVVPIDRGGRRVGQVYVERDLSDLAARVAATAGAGAGMLLVATAIAFALAQAFQRVVSRPIAQLSAAVTRVGRDQTYALPRIDAPPDEIGDLVHAFGAMVDRVRSASAGLMESNDALRRENDERRRAEAALRREIEERRRIEADRELLLAREREASRLKDEFLAAVSHELRTPLNAILGWTQILTSTHPSEPTLARAIASLARNAHAQNRVIEDLLDVSRIVTGKLRLKLDAVDLRTVVEGAVDVVAPMAEAKHVRLTRSAPAVACIVHGDHDRLRQVVWNLLSNAVKFTPPGGAVTVAVTADGPDYRVAVTDTGLGIAPSFLPHVFERFRQADGSMTREHGGLGLGLAIVKELTELHGGSVAVASEGSGLGSTFEIRIPAFAGAAGEPETAPARETRRLDGIRVAAVDDNGDSLDVLVEALTHAGASVLTAGSGAELLARWNDETVDVLVCDLGMPQMDGFEVLGRVRARDGERGRWTPAIALTAYASQDHRARSREAGFQAHVAKPFDAVTLVDAVAAVISKV